MKKSSEVTVRSICERPLYFIYQQKKKFKALFLKDTFVVSRKNTNYLGITSKIDVYDLYREN